MTSTDHAAQQQRADLAEFRANVERAEGAQLNFISMRTAIGRAVLDLVAPAEQASKQVPTIDTPELRDLIGDVYRAGSYNESIEKSEDALMAHIDAQLAGQPAAPVAATEQAIPEGYALVPLRMTTAMQQVVTDDEWQWEDLLAAAEAITEDQHNELAAIPEAATRGAGIAS